MSEILARIQEQLSKTEKAFSMHSDALSQILSGLENLATQKLKTTKALDMLQGARQAYQDILALQTGNPMPLINDGITVATNLLSGASSSSTPAASSDDASVSEGK